MRRLRTEPDKMDEQQLLCEVYHVFHYYLIYFVEHEIEKYFLPGNEKENVVKIII